MERAGKDPQQGKDPKKEPEKKKDMEKRKLRTDTVLFWIALFLLPPLLAAGFWYSYYGSDWMDGAARCVIREKTGIICPGCGGTHAVMHLFHGQFLQSFTANPAVLALVLLYVGFMIHYVSFKLRKVEKEVDAGVYCRIYLSVLFLQWVIRLVLFILLKP